ncbi:MAG: ROK family protein [Thermomicrobiales bacterium]|nr:ROK family protein [Thermomicrobiales bacterium]
MAKAKYAIGVDFGGTKVLGAVVDLARGKVVGEYKVASSAYDSGEALMDRIYEVVDGALAAADVKITDCAGIGVGIAGQVDAERGLLIGTANLSRSVVDLPMGENIQKRYGVPAAIRNDVQIAAKGESKFGAGKKCDDFICVFIGTGIGGAIVRKGEILPGFSGNAGEIGHTTVDANGRICGCGGRGHLEAYASRTAMTKVILGELRRGRKSIVTDLIPGLDPTDNAAAIKSGVMKKAVKAGDAVVMETVVDAGKYIGMGLATVVNFVNPQRIVLGGGVIDSVDLLFETAEAWTRKEALPYAGQMVEIVKAELGDYSGVVGAAVIASEVA